VSFDEAVWRPVAAGVKGSWWAKCKEGQGSAAVGQGEKKGLHM
jgi:hypothetical protein